MADIRLNKLIKQFNIGLDTLVDFLNSKGAEIEYASPNTKVSDEYLPELNRRFGKDSELKRAAEMVDVKLTELLDRASRRTADITEPAPSTTIKSDYIQKLDDILEVKDKSKDVMDKRPLNAAIALEDFDWDAFENDAVAGENREEVAALYDQALQKVTENEVVEGVVTAINRREVVVNIGARREGVISAAEFRYIPDLKVGDKVQVLVEDAENRRGCLVISHKKARQLYSWDLTQKAYDNGEVVKGCIKTRTKGGMIVDIFGIEAFLPGSQIDTKPVKDFDSYVDTTMDFKIINLNKEFRNVVVSHRIVLEAEQGIKENSILADHNSGQKIRRETDTTSKESSSTVLDPKAFFSEKAMELLKRSKQKE